MKFITTKLPGLILIEPDIFKDSRGFFLETYQAKKYRQGGIDAVFVQDNHSSSVKNTLRGLHLQIRHPQAKLIRVLKGEILDVVADVRPTSPHFKKWELFKIGSENNQQIFVPAGYAHGFLALTDVVELEYKCSDYYFKEYERTVRWNDPDLAIEWPVKYPILSDKDAGAPLLRDLLKELSEITPH